MQSYIYSSATLGVISTLCNQVVGVIFPDGYYDLLISVILSLDDKDRLLATEKVKIDFLVSTILTS